MLTMMPLRVKQKKKYADEKSGGDNVVGNKTEKYIVENKRI